MGADLAGYVAGLVDRWKDVAIELQLVDQIEGPASLHYIEESSTGCIRDVAGKIAGELEAHVVFRQQQFLYAIEMLRFVVTDPEQLRKSEAREHWVRGAFQNHFFAGGVIDPVHLRLAALVAPDQRGPDHAV